LWIYIVEICEMSMWLIWIKSTLNWPNTKRVDWNVLKLLKSVTFQLKISEVYIWLLAFSSLWNVYRHIANRSNHRCNLPWLSLDFNNVRIVVATCRLSKKSSSQLLPESGCCLGDVCHLSHTSEYIIAIKSKLAFTANIIA